MCDSESHDSCSNCNISTSDHQCCSLCPITNKRCKRNAVPGLSRCRQHHDLCKSMYNEYKDLCKNLLDTDFKDLNDEKFYQKYKDLEKCVNKRKEQSRICYPPDNRETDYKGCYFNPQHDRILQRYEHKLKKFKKRFDMIKKSRKKEFKSSKEKELKSQFEENKQLELLQERLSSVKSNIEKKVEKKSSERKKRKKRKTKQEVIKEDEDISDILDQAEKKITEIKNNCEIITENGKLCYNFFNHKECKKYCVENCSIWMKELFKNPPNSIKFVSDKNQTYFINIDSLFIFNIKNNNKTSDDVYCIQYEFPYNGKKRYIVQKLGSSKITEHINHDQFIDRICENFDGRIIMKVLIAPGNIKDINKFLGIFDNPRKMEITMSFLNNGLFKPLKVSLYIENGLLTFNYNIEF